MKNPIEDDSIRIISGIVTNILCEARDSGSNFIVFGGFASGELDLSVSDIDVFCQGDKDVDILANVALENLLSNTQTKVLDVRRSGGNAQIIALVRDVPLMFDLQVGFSIEGKVYVDGATVFALRDQGVEVVSLLRAIKKLVGAKKAWPRVPDVLYRLDNHRVGPFAKTQMCMKRISRLIRGYFSDRSGLIAAVLGLDGVGKTITCIELADRWDGNRSILPTFWFHWRPRITFSRARPERLTPALRPHSKPTRNVIVSCAKLLYLVITFWLGYLTSVRPLLVRNALVMADRYYDDLLVDPKRYRYGGPLWLARLVGRFIPRPDLFIFLDLPAEVAHARKPEVPLDEARRLRDRYLALARTLPNARVVDASRPLGEVVAEVERIIIDHIAARTRRRLGLDG